MLFEHWVRSECRKINWKVKISASCQPTAYYYYFILYFIHQNQMILLLWRRRTASVCDEHFIFIFVCIFFNHFMHFVRIVCWRIALIWKTRLRIILPSDVYSRKTSRIWFVVFLGMCFIFTSELLTFMAVSSYTCSTERQFAPETQSLCFDIISRFC